MKQHQNIDGSRRAFYDRRLRAWTMHKIDSDGNQIGEAAYHVDRRVVFEWLTTGEEK